MRGEGRGADKALGQRARVEAGGTRGKGSGESPRPGPRDPLAGANRVPPFSQAYVDEFKFQSILADDFLEFYLEYFPELKEKRVDCIPGEQRGGLAHRLLDEGGCGVGESWGYLPRLCLSSSSSLSSRSTRPLALPRVTAASLS